MTRGKDERVRAVTLAEVKGSARAAAQEMNIPERTVRRWREDGLSDPEVAAKVRSAVKGYFEEAALAEAEIAGLANRIVEQNLRRMLEKGADLSPSELQRVRLVGAIAGTKLREAVESLARDESHGHYEQPPRGAVPMPDLYGIADDDDDDE